MHPFLNLLKLPAPPIWDCSYTALISNCSLGLHIVVMAFSLKVFPHRVQSGRGEACTSRVEIWVGWKGVWALQEEGQAEYGWVFSVGIGGNMGVGETGKTHFLWRGSWAFLVLRSWKDIAQQQQHCLRAVGRRTLILCFLGFSCIQVWWCYGLNVCIPLSPQLTC